MQDLIHIEFIQLQRKVWHDNNIKDKVFQEGDLDLLYGSRFKEFKGKLMTSWLGPYLMEKYHDNGDIQIRTIAKEGIPFLFNGYRLKAYKRPLSREVFINTISKEVNVFGIVISSKSQSS